MQPGQRLPLAVAPNCHCSKEGGRIADPVESAGSAQSRRAPFRRGCASRPNTSPGRRRTRPPGPDGGRRGSATGACRAAWGGVVAYLEAGGAISLTLERGSRSRDRGRRHGIDGVVRGEGARWQDPGARLGTGQQERPEQESRRRRGGGLLLQRAGERQRGGRLMLSRGRTVMEGGQVVASA